MAELATILACGIVRLHARAALGAAPPSPEISPESSPDRLEVPGETVLTG